MPLSTLPAAKGLRFSSPAPIATGIQRESQRILSSNSTPSGSDPAACLSLSLFDCDASRGANGHTKTLGARQLLVMLPAATAACLECDKNEVERCRAKVILATCHLQTCKTLANSKRVDSISSCRYNLLPQASQKSASVRIDKMMT